MKRESIITDEKIVRCHYMLSAHSEPPFLLYRWIYDSTTAPISDEIGRFDLSAGCWVTEPDDDCFVRDNYFGYKSDLVVIDALATDEEAIELASVGWRAQRFNR